MNKRVPKIQEIRKLLRDDQWAKPEPLLPGKAGDPGATAQDIPPKRNRMMQRGYDRHLYKDRNLVERFFNRNQAIPTNRNTV